MFIDQNQRRVNIYAPYSTGDINGIDLTDPASRELYGITEIPDPERESEATHFVQEIDDAPYIINTPKPPEMIEQALAASLEECRKAAYTSEADPLFFKEQRGEVEPGTWLAKVQEIKERFPK